jgi:hypothetical protein
MLYVHCALQVQHSSTTISGNSNQWQHNQPALLLLHHICLLVCHELLLRVLLLLLVHYLVAAPVVLLQCKQLHIIEAKAGRARHIMSLEAELNARD